MRKQTKTTQPFLNTTTTTTSTIMNHQSYNNKKTNDSKVTNYRLMILLCFRNFFLGKQPYVYISLVVVLLLISYIPFFHVSHDSITTTTTISKTPISTTSKTTTIATKIIETTKSFTTKKETQQQHVSLSSPYEISQTFIKNTKDIKIDDVYITIWLHQVHSWFKEDSHYTTKEKVRKYLLDAKEVGFTSVMGDMPWPWTERENQNDIRIDTFHKDWLEVACELDFKLHIVITMKEFPPWVQTQPDYFEYEKSDFGHGCNNTASITPQPSIAHPVVWGMMQQFLNNVAQLLLTKYGSCIRSISPTMNNEFETRFTQERDKMRDYSPHAIQQYKDWQVNKGLVRTIDEAISPPDFNCGPICYPIIDPHSLWWLGFREEFLVKKYIQLCKIVHESVVGIQNEKKMKEPNCLLHIGEMFSSADLLNSNLFFQLAKSEYVDELVMDSNMALSGAPTSPSIVGILVSTAQAYGKIIHYEAATERIIKCDEYGNLVGADVGEKTSGPLLLLLSGIENALDAGTQSLGVTNLCQPKTFQKVYDLPSHGGLYRSEFVPTALIYAPYRAYYAWSFIITGLTCGAPIQNCWHESFIDMPFFGRSKPLEKSGFCPSDHGQNGLIHLWDTLRTRHENIIIIGDINDVTMELLDQVTERYIIKFPQVFEQHQTTTTTDGGGDEEETWHFYEGEETYHTFQEYHQQYPFIEHMIRMPPF